MNRFMLAAITLATIIIAVPVSADRVIFSPTGTTLAGGEIRLEGAVNSGESSNKVYWLGIGLQRLELSVIRFDVPNRTTSSAQGNLIKNSIMDLTNSSDDVNMIGAELSVLPETTLTPGIGVGVWDMTNETPGGRGYYLAVSKLVPLTNTLPLPIHDVKLHAGVGVDGIDGLFAGAEAGFPLGFKLYAEYFQKEFNFAVGWGMLPGLQLKAQLLDGETFVGLQFAPPI
jgi:hypothetical protein